MPGIKVDNTKQFTEAIRNDIGARLARCAVYLSNFHQAKLGVPCPATRGKLGIQYYNASKPGEYPKKRTGFLQASVLVEPLDLNKIAKAKKVTIGYAAAAFYGPVLEVMRKRLGLVRSLKDCLPMLQKLAGGKFSIKKIGDGGEA